MTVPGRPELDPGPEAELDRLERDRRWDLLDRIDDAITVIASDPGSKEARERSSAGGTYGVTIRTRDDD